MVFELQREFADSICLRAPLNELRIQLACGAHVNESVVRGLRPLHYAVYECYEECVKLLLVRGADVNQQDHVGYTALHLAAERGYLDICVLLVERGAQVRYTPDDEKELFPQRDCLADEPLRLAIKNDHYEVAEFLLQHGGDPHARYFLGAEINLAPVSSSHYIELLLRYGAHADTFDRHGMTPLMKSCKVANRECMESILILLSYGADVNSEAWTRQESRRVLHYAIIGGSLEVVLLLIKQGAKVLMPDDYEKPSPLDFAILRNDLIMIHLLLEYAGRDNREKIVNRYSSNLGTPLHVAAVASLPKQEEIMRILLESGANVNSWKRLEEGAFLCTPLVEYLAARDEYKESVIQLLLDYGATVTMASPMVKPNGILRSMRRMRINEETLHLLLPFMESFDLEALRTFSARLLSEEHRGLLLEIGSQPPSLKHIARLQVRRSLMKPFRQNVDKLDLPPIINTYLKFQ